MSLGRTEANSRTLAGAAPLYLQPFSRDLAGLSQARLFPPAGAHFLRLRLGRGAAGSKAQVGWARLEFRAWQSGRGVWGRVVLVAAPATRAQVSAARTLQGWVATFGDATWSGRLGCRGEGRGPAQELRRCWLRSEGVVPWPCWAQSCLLSAVPGKGKTGVGVFLPGRWGRRELELELLERYPERTPVPPGAPNLGRGVAPPITGRTLLATG